VYSFDCYPIQNPDLKKTITVNVTGGEYIVEDEVLIEKYIDFDSSVYYKLIVEPETQYRVSWKLQNGKSFSFAIKDIEADITLINKYSLSSAGSSLVSTGSNATLQLHIRHPDNYYSVKIEKIN
jgi:hypothetical protein